MAETRIDSAAGRLAASIDEAILAGADGHDYALAVIDLKPVRPRTGWLYLSVAVRDAGGAPSRTPLAMGIVSGGGRLVSPWLELRVYAAIELAGGASFDARAAGLEAAFIDLIGGLVPAGGHLMIEYESPGQNETHAGLLLRVPPAATHLGALMFHAGFQGDFKDWYISEGGHEGPRKLQANKSPTAATARVALATHRSELTAFLKRARPQEVRDAAIVTRAKDRARTILKQVRTR